jgi:hypothetical protein
MMGVLPGELAAGTRSLILDVQHLWATGSWRTSVLNLDTVSDFVKLETLGSSGGWSAASLWGMGQGASH